ncbi:leucine-rich repeat protein soc-2 homolog [Salvia hispanica]|uniref:leucine-rich repeat protein soc-2 homolog n=1 Tax=Salvia hispanica TaxID=49212 RepID=UPI00200975FD|nr:leucine-rich repeat protein soc-2 homolog [Salvia hispanica]
MKDFGVKTLSETMGTLIELRYLGLRNNYNQEVPHSFGDLKKLEVLDVALNFMVEIPINIWEIGSLHHIGDLKKLAVLDVALNFMVEIPINIWEIGSLHHIYMSNVIYHEPLKVDVVGLQTHPTSDE